MCKGKEPVKFFLPSFYVHLLFLCPNPSRYFALLSFCAHLSSFRDSTRRLLFFLSAHAFLLLVDCIKHRFFAFIQRDWSWNIAIAQVHVCHLGFLSLTTNLFLLHFLFQFFSLIFSLLGFSFFNLFFSIFFFEFFLKNSFVHLHICTCLFFFGVFLQLSCDIDFFDLSCLYAWPHTWRLVTGMSIMPFRVNVHF